MSATAETTQAMQVTFTLYAELVAAVRASRGWYSRIARETGCRKATLRRMAADPDYDPRISEIEKIRGWFLEHGVPTHWPRPEAKEEASAGAAQ